MSLSWICFPVTKEPPPEVMQTVAVFQQTIGTISSGSDATAQMVGNAVLAEVRERLEALGFQVERQGVPVRLPVLYGEGGTARRTYHADAWWMESGVVVEVEAGGARQNNRALLDILKGMMWQDCTHLVIAVKKSYGASKQNDYEWLRDWVELLYASDRVVIPMESLTVVGY